MGNGREKVFCLTCRSRDGEQEYLPNGFPLVIMCVADMRLYQMALMMSMNKPSLQTHKLLFWMNDIKQVAGFRMPSIKSPMDDQLNPRRHYMYQIEDWNLVCQELFGQRARDGCCPQRKEERALSLLGGCRIVGGINEQVVIAAFAESRQLFAEGKGEQSNDDGDDKPLQLRQPAKRPNHTQEKKIWVILYLEETYMPPTADGAPRKLILHSCRERGGGR